MNNLILLGGIFILILIIIIIILVIVKLHTNEKTNQTQAEKEFVYLKTQNKRPYNYNKKIIAEKRYQNNKIGNNMERVIEEKHNLEAKLHQLEQQSKTPSPSHPNQQSTPAPTHH